MMIDKGVATATIPKTVPSRPQDDAVPEFPVQLD
jgi:hypothetical protein